MRQAKQPYKAAQPFRAVPPCVLDGSLFTKRVCRPAARSSPAVRGMPASCSKAHSVPAALALVRIVSRASAKSFRISAVSEPVAAPCLREPIRPKPSPKIGIFPARAASILEKRVYVNRCLRRRRSKHRGRLKEQYKFRFKISDTVTASLSDKLRRICCFYIFFVRFPRLKDPQNIPPHSAYFYLERSICWSWYNALLIISGISPIKAFAAFSSP